MFDLARQLVTVVIPVTGSVLDRARHLLDADPGMMARDALRAAVALTEKLDAICSFDRDFDRIPGVVRWEPPVTGR